MSFLLGIGAAALPFLKVLAPWAGPRATLALIAFLGLVVSHSAVAGYVWFNGYEARVEAVAGVRQPLGLPAKSEIAFPH